MEYYNPVEDITEGRVGRRIGQPPHTGDLASRYKWSWEQVKYSFTVRGYEEHLYAVCDRGVFKLAVCVDDEEVFNDFYGQYRSGQLLTFVLYAL
jgi:hypothetical protein